MIYVAAIGAAFFASGAAIAQDAPQPKPPGPPITFTADEATAMIGELLNPTLYGVRPDGTPKPDVKPDAQAVADMLQDKMHTTPAGPIMLSAAEAGTALMHLSVPALFQKTPSGFNSFTEPGVIEAAKMIHEKMSPPAPKPPEPAAPKPAAPAATPEPTK